MRISLLLVVLLLGACNRPPAVYHEQLYVFGTLVDITLQGVDEKRGRALVFQVDRMYEVMHRDWHAWRPGELTDLNHAIAAGKEHCVDARLTDLLHRSVEASELSEDLFNPAIGKLIGLWGFHSDDPLTGAPPPPTDQIAALVARRPRMEDLVFRGDCISSRNPAVELDLGGIAKGYAVDIAIDLFRRRGVKNAIVNAGGDLRAVGSHGDRPWRIGIRHPQGKGVLAALDIRGDEAVFTSGNYERYNEHAGVRYAHILDPRTGQPIADITSATVIFGRGALADAAATAMVVAGAQMWHEVAKRMGIKYVMLVDEAGTVYMSPAMQARVSFTGGPPKKVVLSPKL